MQRRKGAGRVPHARKVGLMSSESHSYCPLCQSQTHQSFLVGFDRLFPREENFQYVQCDSCGMIYLVPHPSPEKISSYYGTGYGPHQTDSFTKVSHRQETPLNQFVIRHFLKTRTGSPSSRTPLRTCLARLLKKFCLKNLLMPYGDNRLLDVGCGSGSWLYQHKLLGWETEGVEINENACERARSLGLTIYQGTLFDVPADKLYDVISFNHIIEHVLNPVETLQKAKKLLAPGGRLILLLPNIDSRGFELYGNCWFPLDPPRHLLQFSPKTIHYLARQVDLQVAELKTEAHARLLWKSRNYSHFLGEDFVHIASMDDRSHLIQSCLSHEAKNRLWKKIYKKWMYFPALYWAGKCKGEVMRVILENPGDKNGKSSETSTCHESLLKD